MLNLALICHNLHISEQNQTNNKIPGNPCKTGHSGAKQGETKL